MIKQYNNHKLQTNPRHHEEEPQDIYSVRSYAVGVLLLIHCFVFLTLFAGVLCVVLVLYALLFVLSSFAIILTKNRELVVFRSDYL